MTPYANDPQVEGEDATLVKSVLIPYVSKRKADVIDTVLKRVRSDQPPSHEWLLRHLGSIIGLEDLITALTTAEKKHG